MTILVMCGFQNTWCEFVQKRLVSMGVQQSVEAVRTAITPHILTDKMCASHALSLTSEGDIEQAAPGKAWQIAAADIFIANAESEAWGWADPRNIYFLDFWRDFDPMCKFILVYGSPTQSLAGGLQAQDIQPSDIEAHLNQWVRYHEELLRFYQSNRDHSLLIKIDKFENTAVDVTELLADRLGLEPRLLNDSAMRDISPILALIADKLLAANELEQALFSELESSADLPSNDPGNHGATPQRAYAEFLNARNASALDEEKTLEIGKLHVRIEELNQSLSAAETATPDIDEVANLTNQNELLELQLHQVQEELELYFGKYQNLKAQDDQNAKPEQVIDPVSTPTDTVIDMRSYVNGTGWHSPERAGRWAGPDQVSTIKVPALGPGRHHIEIKVVDAMTLDIARNISVSLDGKPLSTATQILSELTGKLAPLRRLRANLQNSDKPFPMKIVAALPAGATRPEDGEHTLTIASPETISPSQLGQPDTRSLSVCIEHIKVIRIP